MGVIMKNGHSYGDDIPAFDSIPDRPDVADKDDIPVDIMSTLPGFRNEGYVYSTTEQAVGTWLNGKTLYQKTIVSTFGADSNAKVILTDASIEEVYYFEGRGKSYDGSYRVPLQNTWAVNAGATDKSNEQINTFWDANNHTLNVCTTRSPYYGGEVIVTIRYTKV